MLTLSNHIKIDKATILSPNLCDRFSDEDLRRIGTKVLEKYAQDCQSRTAWLSRTEAALDLAMQVQKDKTFPWANCSNIRFPLVTIAALQFHARAYPAIVNGRSVVQCRVIGEDPQGIATTTANKISSHMSWQLLEQDEAWEENQDRALLNVAIVGCGFKKTYYDAGKGHNVSEFVPANMLVVDYWAKSIESARAKTHIIPLYKNDVHERMMRGSYRDCSDQSWYRGTPVPKENQATQGADNRAGVSRPSNSDEAPFVFLEHHCWMDLDGDGYEEPYIVTVEESSGCVVRIVCRFEREMDVEYNSRGNIVRIDASEYFTKMPFIPSPDGSLMDIGFGTILGPLNESVNSSINQLFDAGTLSNTAGGFLGRGAKIRGGVYSFQPFSWQRVDASGDDLRKSIFPLPVREPSAVMFNLLSLLIDYTNRVSGSTDMMAGENPGQNTPAETSRAMIEQGQKVYSAIFKRIWRSMKQEFRKLYVLNGLNMPARQPFGEGEEALREWYLGNPASVVPVADPTITSDGARFAQARLIKEAAMATPGYDTDEVERRYLKALNVDGVDKVFVGTKDLPPPAPDVKIQIQELKNQIESAKLQQKQMEFIMQMQENVRVNNAKIAALVAQAQKMEAEAQSEPGKQNVAAFRAGIEAIREQNAQANAQLDRMMEDFRNDSNRGGSPVSGMEAAPSDSAVSYLGQSGTGAPQGVLG